MPLLKDTIENQKRLLENDHLSILLQESKVFICGDCSHEEIICHREQNIEWDELINQIDALEKQPLLRKVRPKYGRFKSRK